MDLVCYHVITGIMFSVASPFTLVELLKICLSVAVIKTCVCFSLEFCCVAGACQDPSFLGETRSLQVSDFCPKGMTSFLTIYPKCGVL